MLITISGTPGTGKTTIARIVAKKLNATLIDTDFLLKEYKIKTVMDKKRNSMIIDTEKLAHAADEEAKKRAVTIFEGHLSHFAAADITIVLRTEPRELEKRLRSKGWSQAKIKENIEAEAIDIITTECMRRKNVVELDTTDEMPEIIATMVVRAINDMKMREHYAPGRIDWSEKYAGYLKMQR